MMLKWPEKNKRIRNNNKVSESKLTTMIIYGDENESNPATWVSPFTFMND